MDAYWAGLGSVQVRLQVKKLSSRKYESHRRIQEDGAAHFDGSLRLSDRPRDDSVACPLEPQKIRTPSRFLSIKYLIRGFCHQNRRRLYSDVLQHTSWLFTVLAMVQFTWTQ